MTGTTTAFAQNPTDVEACALDVLTRMREADRTLHWAALVDDAFDHGSRRLRAVAGEVLLYTDESLKGLAAISPRLIPLEPDTSAPQLHALLAHCSARPMLSFLASSIPLVTLRDQWAPLHWMHTSDGQSLLLRLADTRCLPSVPETLDPPQWASFAGAIEHWHMIGREGLPVVVKPAMSTSEPFTRIDLNDAQVNTFIAAGEPDAIVDYIQEYLADATAEGGTPMQLWHAAMTLCSLADKYGVDAWADRIALVCGDGLTRGALRRHPDLEPLLASKTWAPGQLHTLLIERGLV